MNQQHLQHNQQQQQQQHTFVPAHPTQNDSPASYCDMYYHPVNQPLRVTSVQAQQPLPRHQQVDNNAENRHYQQQQQQFIGAYDHHNQQGVLINDGFGPHPDNSFYETSIASKQPLVYEHQAATSDAALYDYNNQMFLHDQPQATDRLSGAQTTAYQNNLDHVQDSLGSSVFGDEPNIGFNCAQQIHYMSTNNSQPSEVVATDRYLSPVTGQSPQGQHTTLTQHHHHHHSSQFSDHQHHYQNQQHFNSMTSGYMTTIQPNSISNHQQINEGPLAPQSNVPSYAEQYTMQQALLSDETPEEQYTDQIEPAARVFYQPTEVVSATALQVDSKHQTTIQPQANQQAVNTRQLNGSLINSRAMLELEDHLFGQQQDATRHMNLDVSQQQKPASTTVSPTSKNNVSFTESQSGGQLQSDGLNVSAVGRSQKNSVTNSYTKNEDQLLTTRQPTQNPNLPQPQRQHQELTAGRGCINLTQDRMDFICEKLIGDMDHFGICVIDNFLGSINGEMILKEVQQLYSSGQYTKGRLVNNRMGKVDGNEKATDGGDLVANNTSLANGFSGSKSDKSAPSNSLKGVQPSLAPSPTSSMATTNSPTTAIASAKTADTRLASSQTHLDASGAIRSDRVIWIDGCEDGCSEINNLIQTLCSVITNSSRLSLYSNNRLDKIVINKRTKAHVACYPGNGTRYIKHVDNPNGDGRVITAIYYLNKDWNTERDGGLLRMFPAGMDRVANIEPLFDRALFFWSDRRNPHEVLPAFRDRFAITVWYIGENRL